MKNLFVAIVSIMTLQAFAASDCRDLDGVFYCYKTMAALQDGKLCQVDEVYEYTVEKNRFATRIWAHRSNDVDVTLDGKVKVTTDPNSAVNEMAATCNEGVVTQKEKVTYYGAVQNRTQKYDIDRDVLTINYEGNSYNPALGSKDEWKGEYYCKKVSKARALTQFNPLVGVAEFLFKFCQK